MISVKIIYNEEVRRVQVHTVGTSDFTFSSLIETTRTLFPELRLLDESSLSFSWVDDENDHVRCSSDTEVREAVNVMSSSGNICKFKVKVDPKKGKESSVGASVPNGSIHSNVTCDGCGVYPIVGSRFKCSVRENFDLCETCETSQIQPFPMIKVYTKEQAPAGIFIAMREPRNFHPGHHQHAHHGHHGRRRGEGNSCAEGTGFDGKCWRKATNIFHERALKQQYRKYYKMLSMFPEEVVRQKLSVADKLSTSEIDKIIKSYKELSDSDKATVASESSAPVHPKFDRYINLMIDTNEATVRHKMSIDRLPAADIDEFFNKVWPSTYRFKKYLKMLNLMFPYAVVRQKMKADKIPEPDIHEFFTTFVPPSRSTPESSLPDDHPMDPLFAAASALADTITEGFVSNTSPYVNIPCGEIDESQLEQQLVDEAMRQSLDENNTEQGAGSIPQARAVPVIPSVSQVQTPANTGNLSLDKSSYFQNFSPHASSFMSTGAPKPMARFIKDVTLPDGSTVFPGSVVTKTWRVRNDGEAQWPEGVTLSFSSGDLLAASQNDLICQVPQLKPSEEADISVKLTIPDVTGRHVTYFRLRTKDNNIFGQRLWADVRVVESEPDWVGIGEPSADVNTASAAKANVLMPSALASTVSESQSAPVTNSDTQPTTSQEISPPTPTEVWAKVWAKELQVLRDMGFTDTAALIPLLQEHVGIPVSLCPELNGVPPAEGMQKLVAALLGRSGTFQA